MAWKPAGDSLVLVPNEGGGYCGWLCFRAMGFSSGAMSPGRRRLLRQGPPAPATVISSLRTLVVTWDTEGPASCWLVEWRCPVDGCTDSHRKGPSDVILPGKLTSGTTDFPTSQVSVFNWTLKGCLVVTVQLDFMIRHLFSVHLSYSTETIFSKAKNYFCPKQSFF